MLPKANRNVLNCCNVTGAACLFCHAFVLRVGSSLTSLLREVGYFPYCGRKNPNLCDLTDQCYLTPTSTTRLGLPQPNITNGVVH